MFGKKKRGAQVLLEELSTDLTEEEVLQQAIALVPSVRRKEKLDLIRSLLIGNCPNPYPRGEFSEHSAYDFAIGQVAQWLVDEVKSDGK